MRIYLVSTNPNKVREISSILPAGFTVEPLTVLGESGAVEENGDTYLQNAVKKLEGFLHLRLPLIADDSGLEVQFLDGKPGVHSARFLGDTSFEEKMRGILSRMCGVSNRTARFVCVAAFTDCEGDYLAVEGIVRGTISNEIRGEQGFGYDPIFIPEGANKTFAELGPEFKNELSHRARAFRRLFSLLSLYSEHRS